MEQSHFEQAPEVLPDQERLPLTPIQAAFLERLATLRDSSVGPLPDFTEYLTHYGRIPSHDPTSGTLAGMCLSRVDLQPFAEAGEVTPNSFTFDAQPTLELGRENSWRKVFFGQMHMESRSGTIDKSVQVAVKRFPKDEIHYAVQEAAMLQYLQQQGVPALEVIGLLMHEEAEEPGVYLLTRFTQEVISLDNPDWSKLSPKEMQDQLRAVRNTLVTLHQGLVFHGDAEFKNIGVGERDGSIVVFDVERAVSLRDAVSQEEGAEGEVPIRLIQAMSADFSSVQKSLRKYVYPNLPEDHRPKNDKERFEYELNHILEPYHMALMESDSPYKSALDRAYRTVLERKHREVMGEPIMQR